MVSLKIFTDNEIVKRINEQQDYLEIIKHELSVREQQAHLHPRGLTDKDFEEKLKMLDNSKIILSLRSEIAAKESFIQELKEKLVLDDDQVVNKEYPDFLENRPALFKKLNELSESGYKTEIHKNFFNFLRADLASYEKMLADATLEQTFESKIGIKRGIVSIYIQILYNIDAHESYKR